ncbi:Homoserine dehydrogenase, catalytic [Corchorus capsularis]|uniref:Homoserine dehydrogenase n=1 Tax=Corchorus capsularis TaxID=210143 RepID=A0A1R3HB86_COCAP|nr:Homoserine dehydrogenase, catalytic [Corchorus capsularis]
MKAIPLILMGCGGVGCQLLQHIVSCRSLHANLGVHLRVVGVSDSRSLVVTPDIKQKELDDNILSEVWRVKSDGSSLSKLSGFGECQVFSNAELRTEMLGIASLLGKSTGLALVDCSASSETIGVLKQGVDLGCCIVLANKKPLTSTLEDYDKLVSRPRYIRHESTVGAGLPVISSINRIISSGDPIHRIVGSLSGTLGYVMSEVEDGKPLSQVVKSAKSLGYTEPDPRDDLSGMDVARKALILARLLGRRIELSSIRIESLYPEEMGPSKMSVEDFLNSGLVKLDNNIEERVRKASLNGNVLRYVCVIEGTRCEVGIQELPKNSALGRLRGSDNVLEIYTRCYSEQPLVIQGAGAGNDTTAAGVLADILDIQDLFP